MRIPRLTHCLLALVCTLAGCTQTGGVRSSAVGNSSPSSNIRTVASVGDKPIPIVAGEPGLSQRPETEEIDLPASTGARISGRVYDDRGRPVPNAKVRLAVGGSASGKASYATTDRSGAFTLRGLRAGSYYTVIAEYQAQSGAMSGRIEAKAPDTNVRISLQSRDSESDQAHSTIRPAKSRLSASLEDDDDESTEVRTRADRYNSEDLEPPAAEATSMLPRQGRYASRNSAGDTLPPIRAGWNPRQRPLQDENGSQSQSKRTSDDPGSNNSRNSSVKPVGEDDDEGENPLPPALDSRQVGSTFPGDSGDDPPLKIAAGRPRSSSRANRQTSQAARESDEPASSGRDERLPDREPRPMPDGIVPNTREMRPDSFAPIRGTNPADSDNRQSRSAPVPVAVRRPHPPKPAQPTQTHQTNRARPIHGPPMRRLHGPPMRRLHGPPMSRFHRRPMRPPPDVRPGAICRSTTARCQSTNRFGSPPILARTRARRSSRPRVRPARPGARCFNDLADRSPRFQLRRPARASAASIQPIGVWSTCGYPLWTESLSRSRTWTRISSFLISGGAGARSAGSRSLTSLSCKPNTARIGSASSGSPARRGSSLQERRASAAKAARGLKINYSLLVSSMDGSCPVQKGMQIQFYPTMVLLDRNGHILQREQGATDATLARIDRAVLNALK